MFGAVCFHTVLFASVNKTTRVLKVIHSLVHPFNCTRVRLEPDRDHLFSWVSVRLFGPHQSAIAVFAPAQKIRTKGGNELEFKSNQITFIVTSLQHMCLDEWNSWERAPDSAETINI